MQIDGLSEKPKSTIEEVGEFKLKDREGRSAVQIDLSKSSRPMNEAKYLYIAKVQGQNNKIKVSIHWKPETRPLQEEIKSLIKKKK